MTCSLVPSTLFGIRTMFARRPSDPTVKELLALLAFKFPELGFRSMVTERMIVWARQPTPPGAVTGTQRLPPNGFEGAGLCPRQTSALDANAAWSSGAQSALCISGVTLAGDPIVAACAHAVGALVSLVGVQGPPLPEDVRRMTRLGVSALLVATGVTTPLAGVAALDAACAGSEGQEERRLVLVGVAGPHGPPDPWPPKSSKPGPRAIGVVLPAPAIPVQSGDWARKPMP